uniref:Cytochrome c oxidase copper chaperone n=1 Tax=Philasterides dicentrarchi TaxID=282688 RepID=A0A411KVC7_9CILI|nr:cytochrome c oxidase copper chaperone [Philasterides dicentrarchi]
MENQNQQSENNTPIIDGKKVKICCACPDTKKLRDQCIFNNGQDKCQTFIEAHKECLRGMGFKV